MLLFRVFTQLKFLEKAVQIPFWGYISKISIILGPINATGYQKKNPDTQFNEKWVGKNSQK